MSNYRNNNIRTKSPPLIKTDLDDWETDPDFVRDMDEMDQRWGGSSRTVGSINMSELVDQVRRDHKTMRDKLNHSSQRDYSTGFGGKYGIQHDRKDRSAHDYDHRESLSKHSSQEIKREIITSSSVVKEKAGGNGSVVSDAKRNFMEKVGDSSRHQSSPADFLPQEKPKVSVKTFLQGADNSANSFSQMNLPKSYSPSNTTYASSGPRFEETKRIFKEEKSSSSTMSSSSNAKSNVRKIDDLAPTIKSIQEKFEAYKKEFEDIENKVAKKMDMSKVIKKTSTSNLERSNVEYISRHPNEPLKSPKQQPTTYTSTRSSHSDFPNNSIKSLSEKFETLGREDSENFKRSTEARRKEFFDEIKNQVRETRKELEGFDPIDEEHPKKPQSQTSSYYGNSQQQQRSYSPGSPYQRFVASPQSAHSESMPSSRLSSDLGSSSSIKPKVYTKRETTEERIVSKIVKENDKIIEDETKRDVHRSSSCHGSSDEDDLQTGKPSSMRVIEQNLRSSPVGRETTRVHSPAGAARVRTPEPEVKGAGLMARTLYDYQAAEDDELSFDVDDLITNIEKIDSGWYRGTISHKNGRKQIGLFPANYVKLINDKSDY